MESSAMKEEGVGSGGDALQPLPTTTTIVETAADLTIDSMATTSFDATAEDISNIAQASTVKFFDQTSESSSSSKRARQRHRKKDYYRKIRDQIAYYFSDSNLRSDKFMQKLIGVDDFNSQKPKTDTDENQSEEQDSSGTKMVELNVFLKFNKIAEICKDEQDLFRAFSKQPDFTAFNTTLVYDEKTQSVGRRDPFHKHDPNMTAVATERTIYVEGFSVHKPNIFEWLWNQFKEFGPILDLQTPRYSNSKQLMGFAFIEFSEKDSVEKACKQFDAKLAQKDSLLKENATKKMAQSGNQTDATNKEEEEDAIGDNQLNRKRSHSEGDIGGLDDIQQKQPKLSDEKGEENLNNEVDYLRKELKEPEFIQPAESKLSNAGASSKKSFNKEDRSYSSKLRVMSKKRWNQYKNRYIKLQRAAFATLHTLPQNNPDIWDAVRDSFYLPTPQPKPSSSTVIDSNNKNRRQNPNQRNQRRNETNSYSGKKAQQQHNRGHLNLYSNHPSSTAQSPQAPRPALKKQGSIVRMSLATSNAQELDATKLRKGLRALFDQQVFLGNESPLPHTTEIAFIDVSDRMVEFKADGTYKQKCYIRTHQLESARKLLTEEGRSQLAKLVVPGLQLEDISFLNDQEVAEYWELANASKQIRY